MNILVYLQIDSSIVPVRALRAFILASGHGKWWFYLVCPITVNFQMVEKFEGFLAEFTNPGTDVVVAPKMNANIVQSTEGFITVEKWAFG